MLNHAFFFKIKIINLIIFFIDLFFGICDNIWFLFNDCHIFFLIGVCVCPYIRFAITAFNGSPVLQFLFFIFCFFFFFGIAILRKSTQKTKKLKKKQKTKTKKRKAKSICTNKCVCVCVCVCACFYVCLYRGIVFSLLFASPFTHNTKQNQRKKWFKLNQSNA